MKERKEKKKKRGNERQKSVYIEGDTASVDWSGLWFVGLFYGFFPFQFYLDRVCKRLQFVSDEMQ